MAFLGVHHGQQVAADLHGMTNDIQRRVTQHKAGEIEGFTQRYRINRLVYYERFRYVGNAINREKQIKGLDRAKRVALIESVNPAWEDMSEEWGKPIEPLKILAEERKADASLRSS